MNPKNIILILVTTLFSYGISTSHLYASELKIPPAVTVNIYQKPSAIIALDKAYVLYEIYLTNYMPETMTLSSLITKEGDNHFNVIGGLDKSIVTINPNNKRDRFQFQPGEAKIINMMFEFDSLSNVPDKLTHQLRFTSDSKGQTYQLTYPQITVSKDTPIIVSAPLRGKLWVAGNGLANESIHRRAGIYFNGKPYYGERYAIDFIQIDTAGKTFKGDSDKNTSYYCYNQDILAAAEGKVVAIKDGLPENIPHSGVNALPLDTETIAGNYIIINIGNGIFTAYAHLIPGSLKVKVGDFVTTGQVIAKLGNSGNSSEPHLHFQVMDEPSLLHSNGTPYGFDHFKLIPSEVDSDNIRLLNMKSVDYANQLPLDNSVIDFDR